MNELICHQSLRRVLVNKFRLDESQYTLDSFTWYANLAWDADQPCSDHIKDTTELRRRIKDGLRVLDVHITPVYMLECFNAPKTQTQNAEKRAAGVPIASAMASTSVSNTTTDEPTQSTTAATETAPQDSSANVSATARPDATDEPQPLQNDRNTEISSRLATGGNISAARDRGRQISPPSVDQLKDTAAPAQDQDIATTAAAPPVVPAVNPKRHIRIGSHNPPREGDAINHLIVNVAEVDGSTGAVRFLAVDTWNLHGKRLGHIEHSIERPYDELDGTLDPVFKTCSTKAEVVARVQDIVDGIAESRPRELPVTPSYDSGPPKDIRLVDKYEGKVRGLVFFIVNKTGIDINLQTLVDIQATEDYSATYDTLADYIRDGDDDLSKPPNSKFSGLNTFLADKLIDDWDITIWVLPHKRNRSVLYNWSILTKYDEKAKGLTNASSGDGTRDSVLRDWLHEGDVKRDGKARLYVEVHIHPKEGEEDLLRSVESEQVEGEAV